MTDKYGRIIDYMRISVTDRCNLRCKYCMPGEGTKLISHDEILTFEEIQRLCECAASLGIRKIKLTGGEPLVRREITQLVKSISGISGIEDVTLTTNGCLLGEMAKELKVAGLSTVNISLDTLKRDRFLDITRRDEFNQVLLGIDMAIKTGLKVKINCAVLDNGYLEELPEFLAFAREKELPVRFIEMMPIGQGKRFLAQDNDALLEAAKSLYPSLAEETGNMGNGPARYYKFTDCGGHIGFISAVHHKFCDSCNRVRLTSDGYLKRCLAWEQGISLRELMRGGISDTDLTKVLEQEIWNKPMEHQFENQSQEENKKTMNSIGG